MRINNADLEHMVDRINLATKSPLRPWTRTQKGSKANIGNYHISGAYGGVALHRVANEAGGTESVFNCGYTKKKDLHNRMQAFLIGLEVTK